jgi:hypothetical protein
MDPECDGPNWWAEQSAVSDPGRLAEWIDDLPADPAAIREAAGRLVFHYRANGDVGGHGFAPERMVEINLRYAEDMLARVRDLNAAPATERRAPTERMLGCCRDFSLLFVSMARHKGIPARSRVGFASYFVPGWYLDHVVPEVWIGDRWVLMEPEIDPGYRDSNDGAGLDPHDLPRDRFLVGPQAWNDARTGRRDPARFVVAPGLEVPELRGWPYLLHNLVLDVVALHKQDAVLWDVWGLADCRHPDEELASRMDQLAGRLLEEPITPELVAVLAAEPGIVLPPEVDSIDPVSQVWTTTLLR